MIGRVYRTVLSALLVGLLYLPLMLMLGFVLVVGWVVRQFEPMNETRWLERP